MQHLHTEVKSRVLQLARNDPQLFRKIFNDFDLSSYINLIRTSVIASGMIFELPILVYFLTKIGLVTPAFLRTYRKISLVLVLLLSAVITPPDIASQIIVAIPILVLYEVSIVISKIVIKRQEKEAKRNTFTQK